MNPDMFVRKTGDRELTDREKSVLKCIVQMYVATAMPVGSRFLARHLEQELKLSPASIRNIVADLEELDYVEHPHISAGRMPTDKGYRAFVDSLMGTASLSEQDRQMVAVNLAHVSADTVLRDASRILGSLSRYLSVVEMPSLLDITVIRLQVIPLNSQRFLVVLELDSSAVKTVTLEASFDVDRSSLERTVAGINERISGMKVSFLKENFRQVVAGVDVPDDGLLRLFAESSEIVFSPSVTKDPTLHIWGTQNMVAHPEFDNPEKMRSLIGLIEDETTIRTILDTQDSDGDVHVVIGSEMNVEQTRDYSVIVTSYELGSTKGSIGLIGPKRMDYPRMMALVGHVASVLTKSNPNASTNHD